MSRKELREVGASNNRTNTRSSATVRNGKGLVKVEVRDIAAKLAELGKSNYCVGVSAIDVNLTASGVN